MNQHDIDPMRDTRFVRDTRQAFGNRFYVEKPNRDWVWNLASVAGFILVLAILAGKL